MVHTCYYVTSDYVLTTGEIIEDARWWLGVKGTFLPGVGFGIDTVEEGSPAWDVGLQAGMVITRVNDYEINEEDVLPRAIEESGGVLNVAVRQNADGPSGEATITMQRVAVGGNS